MFKFCLLLLLSIFTFINIEVVAEETTPCCLINYPYFNDFETVNSTASINGQDQWEYIGDWAIAQSDTETSENGSFYLNSNINNVDQKAKYTDYATMRGYITLPSAPTKPLISFDYQLNVFDGSLYFEIQVEGSSKWTSLESFTGTDNHEPYTKYEYFLDNYVGKSVRFRFRQHWNSTTAGARKFYIDNIFIGELTKTLPYPYNNSFETVAEQKEWQNEGDWAVSTAHDEKWYAKTGSYFLDGNSKGIDQASHREHFATLSGYIQLPEDSSNVVVSYDYLIQTFDGNPYLYIQKFGDSKWVSIISPLHTSVYNHNGYVNKEVSLAAYAGEQVRFRYRQNYFSEEGPRVFTVDNFHVGEPLAPNFEYPYFNDFDTLVSTPEINGQDHWNNEADWGISKTHDEVYTPRSDEYFLDINPDVEDQKSHNYQYTNLTGYVPIPEEATNPQVTFWYKANIFSGSLFLEIQEKGSNTWVRKYTFTDSYNHSEYTKFYYDLSSYKGKSIRVRFWQHWSSENGPRLFNIDDFKIGDDDAEENLPYPYLNTFETEEEREEFHPQGDWGISTAHDTDYVPFEGSWFMDNNADFEDQYLHRDHYTTLSSYIAIPSTATLPTLTFKYKASIYDVGVYLEIKRKSQTNWINLQYFTDSLDHDEYVTFELNLEAYKGDEVQFRFRQRWTNTTGPRLFIVDNFSVGDFIQEDFTFPYYNNFDTEVTTASKNGRDHWNTEGDWGISNQNNVTGTAESGDWFLDDNPKAENQNNHKYHNATMTGFVKIPSTSVDPKVSFDYILDIPSGSHYTYLHIQKAGSSTWKQLKQFKNIDNTSTYLNYTYLLNSYKNESVRFRFSFFNSSLNAVGRFNVDNFSISQELLGIWYFEESWEDVTSHGFDLEPKKSPIFNNTVPRARDGNSNTSTCFYTRYAEGQHAVATGTDTQSAFNELTISMWVNPSAYNNSVNTIVSKGDDFSIFLDSAGRIQWHYLNSQLSTASAIPLDKWTHITVTFKDGEQHIYIDGVSAASASVVGVLTDLDEDLYIAAALDTNTNLPFDEQYFEGSIDELRIYRVVQDATAITGDMDVLHPCDISVTLDHYRIEHDGAGLTCEAETFTIKACNDAACTELNEEPVTVDFFIDGTFNNTYTFTGSTTVNGQMASFNQLTPKTVTLSIANPIIPAINSTQCFNGSENTCAIEFSDVGFKFTYGTSNTENIELQTSGINFVAPLKVQAVSSNSGACSALFNNEDAIVGLVQENIAPTDESVGRSFFANGVELAKYNAQSPQYKNVTLTFDSNGFAEIPSVYNDAGAIKLHALYNQNNISAYGGSKNFWVKPYALKMQAKKIDENSVTGKILNGNTSDSSATHAAGVPFEFVISALNAVGDVTKNYVPQGLMLSTKRTGPTTEGVDGILTTEANLHIFDGGTSTSNMSYSEVGLINIDIEDVNYGNSGFNVPSASDIDVGRFIPDHFDVSVKENGEFQNACVVGTSEFTYTGQPFTYKSAFLPQFIIEAKNAQGITTQNYTIDGYNKLSDSGISITFPLSDSTQVGKDLLTLITTTINSTTGELTTTLNDAGDPLHGSQTYTFNANDIFTYEKNPNAKVAEYTNVYQIFINKIEDKDNVSHLTGSAPIDMLPIAISPTGINLRYGRLTIENTFGPETSNLPVILNAEYWNGDEFVVNTLDSCTAYEHSKLNMTPTEFTTVTGEGILYEGSTERLADGLELIAPVTDTGKAELEYNLDEIKWLQYDWDGDLNNDDTNPTASAMFGRFRNNDRVIYWREVL